MNENGVSRRLQAEEVFEFEFDYFAASTHSHSRGRALGRFLTLLLLLVLVTLIAGKTIVAAPEYWSGADGVLFHCGGGQIDEPDAVGARDKTEARIDGVANPGSDPACAGHRR